MLLEISYQTDPKLLSTLNSINNLRVQFCYPIGIGGVRHVADNALIFEAWRVFCLFGLGYITLYLLYDLQ